MSDLTPIPRETCPTCNRPTEGYYDRRAQHMAAAFRSGVPAQTIARAYYVSPGWAMKLIQEQLGKEEVLAVQETYWRTDDDHEPGDKGVEDGDWLSGGDAHSDTPSGSEMV